MPKPKDGAEERTEAKQDEQKRGRSGDTDERNQKKAQNDEPADRMPCPLTRTSWSERHNLGVGGWLSRLPYTP